MYTRTIKGNNGGADKGFYSLEEPQEAAGICGIHHWDAEL